jgi:hypothetical protein
MSPRAPTSAVLEDLLGEACAEKVTPDRDRAGSGSQPPKGPRDRHRPDPGKPGRLKRRNPAGSGRVQPEGFAPLGKHIKELTETGTRDGHRRIHILPRRKDGPTGCRMAISRAKPGLRAVARKPQTIDFFEEGWWARLGLNQ